MQSIYHFYHLPMFTAFVIDEQSDSVRNNLTVEKEKAACDDNALPGQRQPSTAMFVLP